MVRRKKDACLLASQEGGSDIQLIQKEKQRHETISRQDDIPSVTSDISRLSIARTSWNIITTQRSKSSSDSSCGENPQFVSFMRKKYSRSREAVVFSLNHHRKRSK